MKTLAKTVGICLLLTPLWMLIGIQLYEGGFRLLLLTIGAGAVILGPMALGAYILIRNAE